MKVKDIEIRLEELDRIRSRYECSAYHVQV